MIYRSTHHTELFANWNRELKNPSQVGDFARDVKPLATLSPPRGDLDSKVLPDCTLDISTFVLSRLVLGCSLRPSRGSSSWTRAAIQRDRDASSALLSRNRTRKRGSGADRPTDPSCSKRVTVGREERGRSCRYRGSVA